MAPLGVAYAKRQLGRTFAPRWFKRCLSTAATPPSPMLRSAVRAFQEAAAAGSPGGVGAEAHAAASAALDLPRASAQSAPSDAASIEAEER
jgi:hypothetical protein